MDMISTIVNLIKTQKEKINFLAMITKFKQKEATNSLTAITFVLAFTIGLHDINEITLDILASKCEEFQYNLNLTKQALFQRLENGGELLKGLFDEIFKSSVNTSIKFNHIEVLEQFDDVKFTDGSTISLPNKLEELYTGMGGRNSKSAMKVQATYSLFERNFTKLDIFSATKNDNTYTPTILKELKANELQINDLGYFKKSYFQEVQKKQAYYVSRIKKNTQLYLLKNEKYKEVSLEELVKPFGKEIDHEIYLKVENEMMIVRITGIKLPSEVVNEKLRKANKVARSNGKTLTYKEKLQISWFLVITNTPSEKLSIKTVCELYRLRWQIELCFKALKSGLSFDKFSNCGEKYFKCLLYGKLIFIALTLKIYSSLRIIFYLKCGRLISIQRFMKNFRARIDIIKKVILTPNDKTLKKFYFALCQIGKKSFFEIRTRKTTEYELMDHKIPFHILYLEHCSNF